MTIDRSAIRNQIHRAKTALLSGTDTDGLKDLIDKDRMAFSGVRVLYASELAGVKIQKKLSNGGFVQSIFSCSGLLAFSDQIEKAMLSGSTQIGIGVRPLIDTNLFSHLPKLLTGAEFDERERVESTLDYLAETFGTSLLDWTFASLENMREAKKSGNPWPLRKSAAALHFLAYGRSKLSTDQFEEFMPLANDQWRHWLKSDLIWHQVHRRDTVYMMMLLAFLEAWQGSQVAPALRRIMEFCLDQIGTIPFKELYFSWKLLRGIHQPQLALKMFCEAPLKQPKPKSLERINAVAWDLFLFRWCETQMSEKLPVDPAVNAFMFYVPAVTTLDVGLLDATRSCPLRALLVHDKGQEVESVFADELDFRDCLTDAMTLQIDLRLRDPARQASAGKVNPTVLDGAIQLLETHVVGMTGRKAL